MKHVPVTALNVSYEAAPVGKLALKDRRVWFQYAPEFLARGLQLSPFKLPLRSEVVTCEDRVFDGLHGLFNDSLPDGWGRLLLDRHLRSLGIAPETLTVLDRLAHVGQHGMGALTYTPDYSAATHDTGALSLERLARASRAVLEGEAQAVLAELLALNGSSQGARPKIMVGVSKDKRRIIHGAGVLPAEYEAWLIKFSNSTDAADSGAIEYAYSAMARAAGIAMPETHLFDEKYFGVQRFDRNDNGRMHMHSVSGLLHADHRLPALDYEVMLKAALALTKSMAEVEQLFRVAVFNVFAHNRDDHAKNFAFLMEATGSWRMTPAFDLTFSSGPAGEHSTTVMGEGKAPGREHLLALGKKLGIKKAGHLVNEVEDAIARWNAFADESGVTTQSRDLIGGILLQGRS